MAFNRGGNLMNYNLLIEELEEKIAPAGISLGGQ